eukprot:CAMPEP_0169112246 /NCGR_PEP_ID=MMETSP1015-20121227/27533_1 /TAXON_ID=342587 /ORGANISM="Karlodinium micrum, Strain CCMP2283" /LENGTH=205 /DNA_ID=CAMNT_0009174271 /DNA_START=60 /DNA_END=677 /DNA_ORIENTATION=+
MRPFANTLLGCMLLLGHVSAGCKYPNRQSRYMDSFLADGVAYTACKNNFTFTDRTALCQCSKDTLIEFEGCDHAWITPWLNTVARDKLQNCGAVSSGSFTSASSPSGSESSWMQSSPSSVHSIEESGSFQSQHLTAVQMTFVVISIISCCLCCCTVGGLFLIVKSRGKQKASRYNDYEDEDEDEYAEDDYENPYQGDQYEGEYAQ